MAVFVEIYGVHVGSYGGDDALQNAKALADELNAAFNKRLDEELAKAVEEFRERMIVKLKSVGLMRYFEEIRALPTEPEEK